MIHEDRGYTEQWDFSRYEMIVYDHTQNEPGGKIINHEIYPENDPKFEEYQALLDVALWDAL